MSGGSYNYLYSAADVGAQRGDIERMRDRLDQLAARDGITREEADAFARGARDTRVVLGLLERVDARARALTEVWHAVEWYDSSDWGAEQMRAAVTKHYAGGG